MFISGVHGVGKTSFCSKIKRDLDIDTYSASALIAERKHAGFPQDKLIPDIEENQQYLLMAVRELDAVNPTYLLDGHFCLLDAEGRVTRIPADTFVAIGPTAIVLLTEDPNVIADRRKQRDGIDHDTADIRYFQEEEATYAAEVAGTLGVPFKVSTGASDVSGTVDFVREMLGRDSDGR